MALLCQLGSAPFAGKRPYLSDYKQLTDGVYCYQQAKGVLLRSLLMQGVLSLNRYTRHLEKSIALEERGEKAEDFNEEEAIRELLRGSWDHVVRNSWILLARKFLEGVSVRLVDVRTADRLTKDILKSALRKLDRFGPFHAAKKVFCTSLYANILPGLSFFMVDCGYGLFGMFQKQTLSKQITRKGQWTRACTWMLRRLGQHSLTVVFSAMGVAFGTYLNTSPKYTIFLVVSLFETVGAELYNASVDALMCC